MRKKPSILIALVLVIALVVLAGGCGGTTTTAPPATQGGQTTQTTAGGGETTTSAAPAGDNVIKIGATCPLTGGLSKEGKLFEQGYKFWEKMVNAKGGIDVGGTKYQVKIIIYDDASNAQTAGKLTEQLISQDKVNFLLSPYSSGLVQATSSIAEKYKMVNIAPIANAESLYTRGYKYIFGVLPAAGKNLSSIVVMADANKMDIKSLVVVTPDDLFPLATAEGVKRVAEEKGWTVEMIKYPKTASDLSAIVSQIKGINPDAVISSAFFEQAVLLAKQMKEQRVSPKLIGFQDAPNIPDFVSILGKDANGICGTTWWSSNVAWKDSFFGTAAEFAETFKKEMNTDTLTYHVAAAAAGAYVLQLAIEEAGSLDTEKVREALLALDVETFLMPVKFGKESFGEEGDMDQINISGYNLPVQIQDGKPLVVYPDQVKQAEPIFPFPGWNQQ